MTDDQVLDLITKRLRVLNTNKSNDTADDAMIPKRWFKSEWNCDPFTLGCYSYVPVGVHDTGTVWNDWLILIFLTVVVYAVG